MIAPASKLRFVVIGTGGVGGYFGARLAESGQHVTFIARGAHRAAIERDGLHVQSAQGDVSVQPARVFDDPSRAGSADFVILAVKTWQVEETTSAARSIIGPRTRVLSLQNGVDAPEQVARILGREHVIGGVAKIISFVSGPGRITHAGYDPAVTIGALDQRASEPVETLRAALAACRGVSVTVAEDIQLALWEKFLFITGWAGVGAVTRAPVGIVRSLPETRQLMHASLFEIERLARAEHIALRPDIVPTLLAVIDSMPPDGTSSLQRDIAAGRPSELDELVGSVVRRAARLHVPTPINTFIHAALTPLQQKARGTLSF